MSYSNIRARLGVGTNNLAEQAEYPLDRITNNYMLLLSLYRGSWIAGKVIDVMAEDMLKFMPRIQSQASPQDLDRFNRVVQRTYTQAKLLEALKWGRLFGGAVAVICIEGAENLAEPLDLDEILPGKYRGLIVLDRWSGVQPGDELISDINNPAEFGLPKFYTCDLGESGLSVRVHHSRILRFVGRQLPNWERQFQLNWGMSELERVFDELKKRDYLSWSVTSLVSRANIWAIKDPELSQALSGLGMTAKQLEMYVARLQAVSDSMNNQGLLPLGKDSEVFNISNSFSGLSDILATNMLDVAGSCDTPVSRLYGRSYSGIGQSGEGDLQVYYDTADQKRNRECLPQIDKLYRVIAVSTWGEVPDDMDYQWPPIRTLSDKDRSDLAKGNSDTIISAFNSNIIGRKTALKELRQQSELTGIFSNITDEMISAASDETGPDELSAMPPEAMGEVPLSKGEKSSAAGATGDAWDESKHPREKSGENAGEFTSKGGGGSASKANVLRSAPAERNAWPEHIQALKLPPAWTDVRINPDADADLLAVGKDSKGRPQYVYSERFRNSQAAMKFSRVKELDVKFDKIAQQNEGHLSSEDPKVRENARCARLVMAMGVRPGSDDDTKAKVKAYGATTLEGRHVVTEGDQVYLRFTGKKGVAINLPVSDPGLAHELQGRANKYGPTGRLFPGVSDASLLEYIHTLDGGGFKTKDFRTLLATRLAVNQVREVHPPKTMKDYKKRVFEVAKSVSARLGNTPTVALQSYINPVIFAPWRNSLVSS